MSAKKHTNIPENEIMQMVLNTMIGTGGLMLANNYSFELNTKKYFDELCGCNIYSLLPNVLENSSENLI